MKIRVDLHNGKIDFERESMSKGRFKIMCAIACLLVYIAIVAIDSDGFASILGLFLCGGVCAGILCQDAFKDI